MKDVLYLKLIETMSDGTQRLQSQMFVGRDNCDFVIKDNVLYSTIGRHSYQPINDQPYQIVENIINQPL